MPRDSDSAAADGDVPAAPRGLSHPVGGSGRSLTPYFAAIALLIYAVAFLKAIRLPNLWATTQLTFNYSEGFVRRGLVGQLIRMTFGEGYFHYWPLAIGGIVTFVLVIVTMLVFFRRTLVIRAADKEYWVAFIVLGASPGMVFLIHEIGYLDHIGLLALLVVVLLAERSRRRWLLFPAVSLVGALLAFVHEVLVVMFVPALFFALICLVVTQLRSRTVPRAVWLKGTAVACGAALIPFVASAVVGQVGTKSPAVVRAMQARIARHADFALRNDAFEVLAKPLRENLLKQMPYHWSIAENRAYLYGGFQAIAPALAFLLFYGIRVMARVSAPRPARIALMAAFVGATVAPLFLNFIGWDNSRWNAISVIDAFCCLGIARLFFGIEVAADGEASPLILTLGAGAIVLGLCTSFNNFLFDGYAVRWFPFSGPFRWR